MKEKPLAKLDADALWAEAEEAIYNFKYDKTDRTEHCGQKRKPALKSATGAANRKSISVLSNMPATGGTKNIPKSETTPRPALPLPSLILKLCQARRSSAHAGSAKLSVARC
jgi:hypothetical protein